MQETSLDYPHSWLIKRDGVLQYSVIGTWLCAKLYSLTGMGTMATEWTILKILFGF